MFGRYYLELLQDWNTVFRLAKTGKRWQENKLKDCFSPPYSTFIHLLLNRMFTTVVYQIGNVNSLSVQSKLKIHYPSQYIIPHSILSVSLLLYSSFTWLAYIFSLIPWVLCAASDDGSILMILVDVFFGRYRPTLARLWCHACYKKHK